MAKYVFNEESMYWENTAQYNYLFLRAREVYFNDVLKKDGVVPLFNVLKSLGLKVSKNDLKQIWEYKPGTKIDFGLDGQDSSALKFVLEFNTHSIDSEV